SIDQLRGGMIITGPLNDPLNGEIRPGTIVTYKHGKELVTHRVCIANSGAALTRWQWTAITAQSIAQRQLGYQGQLPLYRWP
ncbi:hypothetical protein ACFLVA_01155, partial [Chloroflexota bacterium]